MVVLAVVGTASVGLTWSAIRSFATGAESLRLQSEASVAMERITRELRAVPLDEEGTPDIQSIGGDSISWHDGEAQLALVGDQIVYTRNGVESVLCSGVAQFSIRGSDSVDESLPEVLSGTACDAVRRLTLEIGLAEGEATAAVRTKIFLRCMALEVAP